MAGVVRCGDQQSKVISSSLAAGGTFFCQRFSHSVHSYINTTFALGAPTLALGFVSNPGAENWGIRLPEHHATLPDTSRSQTEGARLTFGHNPISE